MYSAEQRMKAVEAFARFGCSAADTIAELGYPTRHTLRNWLDWQPFLGHFSQRLRPAFRNSTGLMYPSVECIRSLLYHHT